jgi:hypothetical protein
VRSAWESSRLAVIIGIAEHDLPRLKLASPVRDAEALANCEASSAAH